LSPIPLLFPLKITEEKGLELEIGGGRGDIERGESKG
jgi:hypothetical protein